MHVALLKYLRCPATQSHLRLQNPELDGNYVRHGFLVSETGTRYEIVDSIPRFSTEGYAESFTVEWEKHPTLLMANQSGLSMYETRFRDETRWPANLSGEIVLEAGCGPGGLTAPAIKTGAMVLSFDLSRSVDIALKNNGQSERNAFIQASLFEMPFADNTFDRIFCFGVLQNTPDPQRAFRCLVTKLKPGGSLAVDSYIVPDPHLGGGHTILRAKYRARKVFPRRNVRLLHFIVRTYVALVWPIAAVLRSIHPRGAEVCRTLLIDDYAARMTGMNARHFKEFAVLDIFDFVSPAYDIPQTLESFRKWFTDAGLEDIDVRPGYNGLEGRAKKPRA